jgi:hypothetical protein
MLLTGLAVSQIRQMPKIVPEHLKKSSIRALRLQPQLDRDLRSLAIADDQSVSAIITEAIKLYLADKLKPPTA